VHPRAFDGSDWSLGEDKNRIILSLNVGESTTEEDLEVATTEDQTLLVIRYKKKEEDKSSSPASSLDVRLLMPPGYDSNKMQGIMWNTGWLEISIPKPKHERKTIPITPSTKTQTTP
jgi:HSP20 family molecular chaperone IbpA